MNHYVSLLIVAAVVGFGAGCRSGWTSASVASISSASIDEADDAPLSDAEAERRAEAYARYAAGVSYDLNEQPERAQEEFYKSALQDPGNESLVVELARRFLADKQTDKALALLSKSAERPTASGMVLAWQARAYLADGKTNRALAAGRAAITRKPDSIAAYQTLTDTYLKTGQPRAAWSILRMGSSQAQADPSFLLGLAELYNAYARRQPAEAAEAKHEGLAILERAAEQKPAHPALRQRLADQWAAFGEQERAAQMYLELLSQYSQMPMLRDAFREKLANLYLQGSDKARAAEHLEAIVRDHPTQYPQAYYVLGTLAFEEKKFEKAAGYFEKTVLFKPDLEQAYYDLASSQMNMQQPAQALDTLAKAQAKFPNSFIGEFFTGLAYGRLKNYDEAVKHFVAAEVIARATDPTRLSHILYFHLGSASERKGDMEQAEKYFTRCLELSPDFAEALNYLGYMWAEKGKNLEKAKGMIEKAVSLEPKNAAFLDSLAWVLFKLNQYGDALQYALKAVELNEDPDATLFDHVGDIYHALNKPEQAREAWTKSLAIEPNDQVRKKIPPASSR